MRSDMTVVYMGCLHRGFPSHPSCGAELVSCPPCIRVEPSAWPTRKPRPRRYSSSPPTATDLKHSSTGLSHNASRQHYNLKIGRVRLPKSTALRHPMHTRTKNEVLFEDTTAPYRAPGKEEGCAKIDTTCERARSSESKLDHCWIGTCWIDKKKYSELSEAIDSM